MALCSFFFLFNYYFTAFSLPLGRSSRAEPAAVKLSALKGVYSVSSIFHTCTRNTIYRPKHQPRSPGLPAAGEALPLGGFIGVFLEQSR